MPLGAKHLTTTCWVMLTKLSLSLALIVNYHYRVIIIKVHSSTLPLILNKHQFWNNRLENLHKLFFFKSLITFLFIPCGSMKHCIFRNYLLISSKKQNKKDPCNIERQWSKEKKCACHLSSLCVKSGVNYGACATGMCGKTQEYMVCQGTSFKLKVWASISLLYSAAGTPKSLASLGHGHVFHMFKVVNCDQLGAKRPWSWLPPWSSPMDGLSTPYSDILFMI